MDWQTFDWSSLINRLERLVDLGEKALVQNLTPPRPDDASLEDYCALRWHRTERGGFLSPIEHPDLPDHADLLGIDRQLEILRRNTRQFVHGLPANNLLLWGDRGTGKSTAIRSLLRLFAADGLKLIELQKEDLFQLPDIAAELRRKEHRFILFCDDLSFDEQEIDYRELKALLEGGLEARPDNLLIYATSNRRHLMPERMQENTGEDEIHPEERIAEKLSLSDRFGISLGFYSIDRENYLNIVRHLAQQRALDISAERLRLEALDWSAMRGARSGRIARQFIDDLTGRLALQKSGL